MTITDLTAQQEALTYLDKIASRIPGVVYQFRLSTDGCYSVPYSSKALYDIFKVFPEEVRNDATTLFSRIHYSDYADVVCSIEKSAHNLKTWQSVFRVIFDDGSVHWLEGNATPEREADGATLWHGFICDVTERKKIESQLHSSEARFRAIVELSPVPIALNDRQQNITFLSPAFIKTFGYDLTDIPTVADWYLKAYPDPTYRQHISDSWQAILEEVESKCADFPELEVEVCCKDGTLKNILISVTITSHEADKLYLISLCDITNQKQKEQELRNNKRFNTLIESIPDFIFLKDGAGRWLITNEPAKQLLKLHDIPWYGKTDLELAELQPEFSDAHKECCVSDEKTWQAKQLVINYETLMNSEGELVEIEVRKSPLFDSQGQRQALVIMGRDITEQNKLLKQLNKLALAVEQSPESIVITDLHGRIEYVNETFVQNTGYTRAEVIGQNPQLLASGKTPIESFSHMWKSLAQGYTWKGEFINKRKDNSEYIEFAVIAPLRDTKGLITHYVAVKEDVTEKKRLGRELDNYRNHLKKLVDQRTHELEIAKAQAEQANQAKSEFLANMSHEIRTPMNAILGFSEILTHLVTDTTQRYYLDAIHRSGKTLLQLINDILDLSKIEARKMSLEYRPVSLRALLTDIDIIFRQKAAEKSLEFSIVIDEKLPDLLLLDEIRLRQVLLNLVGNAIKFTADGFVTLAVTANFQPASEKLNLMIAVYDSGIGIPEAQRESIFAAFTQQAHQSIEYGGTGLGLTISQRLSELMGGTISVESEEGHGSCFTVTLNGIDVVEKVSQVVSESLPTKKTLHFQPARILLVDDRHFNRVLITAYLTRFKQLTLIEAKTGEQALDLIKQQKFDLILMDRRLPDIDGDSVCQQIKALPDYAEIPIVMVSASLIEMQKPQPRFYDRQINKPVSHAELLEVLQAFLPLDENPEITEQPHSEEIVEKDIEEGVSSENLQTLITLLTSHYLPIITKINHSAAFKINQLIEIAEQLLALSEQYHCSSLQAWANTLKNHALLFDITHLSKTLTSFSTLLEKIRT